MNPSLAELLKDPRRAQDLPAEVIAPLMAQCAALQSALATRLASAPSNGNSKPEAPGEDRLLTPEEAAGRLGVDVRWLYRHARQLPFTRRLSRKALRFSEVGLRRWLAKKELA